MSNVKITDLDALSSVDNSDLIEIVDVSDSSMALTGTNKKITRRNLIGANITPASSTAQTSIDFEEDTDNGTNKITVTAPASISSDKTITLPDETGEILTDASTELTLGWIYYTSIIPTRTASDTPTFELTFSGASLTSFLSVGQKVKFTQNSATVYGIITKLTSTVMTIYCGTDYSVGDTATYPISNFAYSMVRSPHGFPMSPSKWTVESRSTTASSQSSPVNGTWYNLGSFQISVPIGCWNLGYDSEVFAQSTLLAMEVKATLSTSASSVSDTDFLARTFSTSDTTFTHYAVGRIARNKIISLESKTTYYFIESITVSGVVSITKDSATTNATIRAVCSYL